MTRDIVRREEQKIAMRSPTSDDGIIDSGVSTCGILYNNVIESLGLSYKLIYWRDCKVK